jgi:hypothetical protein
MDSRFGPQATLRLLARNVAEPQFCFQASLVLIGMAASGWKVDVVKTIVDRERMIGIVEPGRSDKKAP